MRNYLAIVILALFFSSITYAQNCSCSVQQVLQNEVESCDLVVGEIRMVNSSSAFRTAIRDANAQNGNMTILIEDGVYEVASTTSYPYLTANNVVIRSASGNRDAVVLTGQGMRDVSPGVENVISVQGNSVTIADLTIRDVGNHAIATSADDLTVYNVRIQDTYEQMLKGNKDADGNARGHVSCSLFEYTSGVGPNWYIGGIDIHQGRDWVVEDNVFMGIRSPRQTIAEHAIHFWSGSSGTMVDRNIIINCDRGIGFGLGGSRHFGGTIRNNAVYNDGMAPFSDVGIALESADSVDVYHNTVLINTSVYPNAIEYRFDVTRGGRIMNNLTNGNIRARDGGTAGLLTNYSQADWSWFKDPVMGDFTWEVQIDEALDQGTPLGLPYDLYKNDRARGGPLPDLGAVEQQRTTSSDHENLSDISLKQNPTDDWLTFMDWPNNEVQMSICNIHSGIIIYSASLESNQPIWVGDWPAGMYLAACRYDDQLIYLPWIKH